MSLNHLLSNLSLIIFVFSFSYISTQKCGENMFFRPNDTYDTNRRLVLSTLASNVSSRDGFYNVSVGEGTGKIYALGLCIPRTDPKVCSDCIEPASVGLLQNCPQLHPLLLGHLQANITQQGFLLLIVTLVFKQVFVANDDITSPQSLQFDSKTIEVATDNFSANNKVGQGGFGEVYKGTLPNGTVVAVKRLSKNSGQGTQEFKNEVVLVAKLQHRNLVRFLGFCLEGYEQILVYEFVPNKSLDYILFDQTKRGQLDWRRRYNIIGGIARGILYLHQDSRLTIIHRDLKASNILLDEELC